MICVVTIIIVFLLHYITYTSICTSIYSARYLWKVAIYIVHVGQTSSSPNKATIYGRNMSEHFIINIKISSNYLVVTFVCTCLLFLFNGTQFFVCWLFIICARLFGPFYFVALTLWDLKKEILCRLRRTAVQSSTVSINICCTGNRNL